MTLSQRVLVFMVVLAVAFMADIVFNFAAAPQISKEVGLAQVNGGDIEAAAARSQQGFSGVVDFGLLAVMALTFVGLFGKSIGQFAKSKLNEIRESVQVWMLIGISLAAFSLAGCLRKPYDVPEYVEIDTNETAFVLPLEGDTGDQVNFESAKWLDEKKVAAKRVQITHRWNQTGRWETDGEWIPAVRVIKVSRTPVTREWVAEANKGTSDKDQAIWIESSDSVSFSTGFSCSAYVAETDTSQFLYSYSGQSLSEVMDTEMRARVQSQSAEFAAGFSMDLLRGQKKEMIEAVRGDVIEFFKKKGITVSTLGQFGGFTYVNPKIQESIDTVFVAQQEKEVAKALLEAQADKNKRLEQEGEGEALKVRKLAQGQADAAITEAEGRAKAIKLVAESTAAANQDPLFLALKKLEVETKQVERWDGKYPLYMMTTGQGGQAPSLLLNVPTPPTTK